MLKYESYDIENSHIQENKINNLRWMSKEFNYQWYQMCNILSNFLISLNNLQ